MKNIKKLIVATSLFIGSLAFAQAPEKMSYQAVVRNTTNNLVTNQPVGMQISILQGSATGTAVYVETQTPTSNANGLVSLEIGGGAVVSGNMATINWANGPYFIKTETDPTGGSSYTITGTSQLLSAPYALYAKTSGDGWNKNGNIGTVEGTNFIGNVDNKSLEFKVNNVRSGFISNSSLGLNTFFGYNSGAITVPSGGLDGNWNTGVGYNTLSANTTGHANTALGIGTLRYNTTGIHNVAVGADVLENNLSGVYNVAVGSQSLRSNTSGINNTALGRNTLFSNTIGSNNIVIGYNSVNNGNNHNNVIAIGTNVNLLTNRNNVTVIGNNISDASITQDNMTRIGSNVNTLTEVTGQVKVNAQSTSDNFTLPTTRGTANQVLTTDGAGATQWVTPSAGGSGASVQLFADKVGGSSETLPVATSTSPTTIVFNNVINSPTLGTYNNTTGVFTVGTTGAGTYLIQVKLITNDNPTNATNTPPIFITLIKNNATYGTNGADVLYGDYPTLQNVLPANMKGQGSLTKVVQLAAGDTFRIVAVGANSSTAAQPIATVAGSNITIMKL